MTSSTLEAATLKAAAAGDERAFREVVAPHTRELHLHCYRMLGSVADAEETLQDVLLAAWRGLPDFAGRSSIRTWLYRIATNRCLNAIRDGKRRPPAEPVPPFQPPEPCRRSDITWLQPYPDSWLPERVGEQGPAARYQQREAVELAFVVALQRLPPRQTASLLLCDVLGYSVSEAAAILDTSATAIKGTLQRARASLHRQPVTPGVGGAGLAAQRALAKRFAAAYTADDLDGVLALLTDDAWLAMPPAPHEYHGRVAIASFLRASAGSKGARTFELVATMANNQPAFGAYLAGSVTADRQPIGVIVLTMAGDRIGGITRFLDETLPAVFGLAGVSG